MRKDKKTRRIFRVNVPSAVKEFSEIVYNAGYEIYLVGGAVRNIKRGIVPEDYDFTTSATPQQVMKLFKRVIPVGINHGTVTVLFKNFSFEVTTFRIDGKYSNFRHPDSIVYSSDIYEDLKRRDFTINSMAIDLHNNEIIDAHNGLEDLRNRIIRSIGNPDERFAEDGLRILRACRFTSQLDFDIEPYTLKGMFKNRSHLAIISAERIRDELIKIMKSDLPSRAFLAMKETSVLEYVIPELLEGIGMEQRERHRFDVFHHLIYSCDFAEKDLVLRLSALLHDIGKPKTFCPHDGVPTFYDHDKVSAEMAGDILRRLRFPKSVETEVCRLVENHMFHYTEEWSDGAVRRFIAKVGKENIFSLFKLRLADRAGSSGVPASYTSEDIAFMRRIDAFLKNSTALTLKELDINGNVLNRCAEIPKGPAMGKVLNFLLDSVIEDPMLNSRDELLKIGKNFYQTRLNVR